MPPKTNAERQKAYRERLKKDKPKEEKQELRAKWRQANAKRAERKQKAYSTTKQNNTLEVRKNAKNNTTILNERLQKLTEENTQLKRRNKNLRQACNRMKKRVEILKKRLLQQIRPDNDAISIETRQCDDTPLTKSNSFLEETLPNVSMTEKEKVKKKLILLNTITDSLKSEFNKADTKEKKVLKKVATNDIANKYKLKTAISNVFGLKGRIRKTKSINEMKKKYKKDIQDFFEKEDKMTKNIPENIIPIKGTMKLHQIVTDGNTTHKYKMLSCFDCQKNICCDCYYTKEHELLSNTLSEPKASYSNKPQALKKQKPAAKRFKRINSSTTTESNYTSKKENVKRQPLEQVTLLSSSRLMSANHVYYDTEVKCLKADETQHGKENFKNKGKGTGKKTAKQQKDMEEDKGETDKPSKEIKSHEEEGSTPDINTKPIILEDLMSEEALTTDEKYIMSDAMSFNEPDFNFDDLDNVDVIIQNNNATKNNTEHENVYNENVPIEGTHKVKGKTCGLTILSDEILENIHTKKKVVYKGLKPLSLNNYVHAPKLCDPKIKKRIVKPNVFRKEFNYYKDKEEIYKALMDNDSN
ncbi:unnamed protein product [Euphydryas editha]|uniref:Uncharacterized protein n=1 Tax=Euphydryas editha TaxID=104508 RepID=A0AAU9U5D7_EUPED|nr:unnamed protein product [Euphydryas editha]